MKINYHEEKCTDEFSEAFSYNRIFNSYTFNESLSPRFHHFSLQSSFTKKVEKFHLNKQLFFISDEDGKKLKIFVDKLEKLSYINYFLLD